MADWIYENNSKSIVTKIVISKNHIKLKCADLCINVIACVRTPDLLPSLTPNMYAINGRKGCLLMQHLHPIFLDLVL